MQSHFTSLEHRERDNQAVKNFEEFDSEESKEPIPVNAMMFDIEQLNILEKSELIHLLMGCENSPYFGYRYEQIDVNFSQS